MRLSKIAKDFNVGIQTLVDFLEKKGGDASISWNPMSQVPDHLYELLSKEFNKDKSVKQASERERQERMLTRDKMKEEARQVNAINQGIPQTRQQSSKPKAAAATTPAKTETEEKQQVDEVTSPEQAIEYVFNEWAIVVKNGKQAVKIASQKGVEFPNLKEKDNK